MRADKFFFAFDSDCLLQISVSPIIAAEDYRPGELLRIDTPGNQILL